GRNLLFAINRADIVDISPNDVITVDGFPGAEYLWTDHDGEFFENNPDDDVFLEIERTADNTFRAIGIVLRQQHPQPRSDRSSNQSRENYCRFRFLLSWWINLNHMKQLITLLLAVLIAACTPKPVDQSNAQQFSADLIVYGGTSAAVTAAVQAKRMGKSVIIVSPDVHLGGLSSGGLGFTDTGNKAVIGGISKEFYQRLFNHYQQDTAWKWQKRSEYGNHGQHTVALDGENSSMWIFEPHAAERVFEDFIREYEIPVHRDTWLDRSAGGTTVDNGKIVSFRTLNGNTYT